MISTIEFEKCVAGAGIFGIIVNKLCYEKKPYSIILLEVDKDSEVSFYCTILPLSLAIHLWVEGGGESLFNAEKIV